MDVKNKQQQLEEYKDKLRDYKLDQLKEVEEQLIKDADELDKVIQETSFDLPKENYSIVCGAIRDLLDKQTVNWQYALAYISMYDFWNPEKKEDSVPYPMLDSTLRVFGSMEFTGYKEWAAVTAINKYFQPVQEDYANLTEKVYDIAAKHNVVMELMGLGTPVESKES